MSRTTTPFARLRRACAGLCAGLAVVAAALLLPSAAPAQTADEAFGERVREYLLANPEVIVEALTLYQQRQEAEEARLARDALVSLRDEIEDGGSPWSGNADGDVIVVEFFDYQCGYCRRMHEPLQALLENDDQIRFVYKEFPILGPVSVIAARAALASREQGLYVEFHNALMGHPTQLTETIIFELAESLGLDLQRLRADMSSPAVMLEIQFNLQLAHALGIGGTPTFVIGDQVIRGAVPRSTLETAIAAARSS